LSTIASADRIVVLRRGRVVEQGSHLELLRKRGLYTTLWTQQGLEKDEPLPSAAAQGG
jgi:ABC-type transport system involved in Fe-S cluster assembly fused permease/ATPase subunit